MKWYHSPTTVCGLVAAVGACMAAGAVYFDPHETLPAWIWPVFKMMQAGGTAAGFYFAADWKRKDEPDKPSETKPTSENKP